MTLLRLDVFLIAASDAAEASTLARAVIETHGLANSDRVVAWAPTPSDRGIRVARRHLADQTAAATAR